MATHLIPRCAPASHYPNQTYGDGNCLFRAVSIALTGNQDLHIELRVRTFFELCLKKNDYLDDQYLKRLTSLDSCMAKLFESSFDTSSVKPGISKAVRISNAYDVGVLKTIKSGNYSNMWHMYALSNVNFNHTWTQTWPCIVPVKNDKHSFRCTSCNEVIDCGKQGIGDVKRHIQRDEHKKNAKGSRNQTTLFQACAQAQNNEDKVCTSAKYN